MNAVMEFLTTRRSRPAKMIGGPGPEDAALRSILEAGLRVPDHGKLEPWRLIVVRGTARARIADLIRARAAALGEEADKAAAPWDDVPVAVVVVGAPVESAKIPQIEQTLSVGCVALSVLNAALASGWAANWLSGWASRDPEVLRALGIAAPEWVAGFIHIGTCARIPPERPRPDPAAKVAWVEA